MPTSMEPITLSDGNEIHLPVTLHGKLGATLIGARKRLIPYLDGRAEMIQNTLKDRTSLYDRTTTLTNCIAEDERDTYAIRVDVALYKCQKRR